MFAAKGKKYSPISGPAVWDRRILEKDDSWRFTLDAAALENIDANLRQMNCEQTDLRSLTTGQFPLPALSSELALMRDKLGFGFGIVLISGFPIDRYSQSQIAVAYYGLAIHLGTGVSQSHRGDYIGEVTDKRDETDRRPYHNGGIFTMHRDPVDATGLISIRRAKRGGESRVISAATAHNVLLEEHPEVMEHLYSGYPYMRLTPDRGDTDLYTPYRLPVFKFTEAGEFMSHYIPQASEFYQERDAIDSDAPEVTAQKILKKTIWERPELYTDMMMEPGDIQFVNNRLLMHSRTDYVDWPDSSRLRLLLRVWLQMPEWGPLPADQLFYTNVDRAGGGIAAQTLHD